MDKPLFKLIIFKEAREFLDALSDKVREKMLYNIRKVRFGMQDKDVFKKLDGEIWEFRTSWYGMVWHTSCLPFGIMTVKHS